MTPDTRDSMSLADEARTLRERVAARLAELEPLVREYEELQRVAADIGLGQATPKAAAITGADSGDADSAPAARDNEQQRPTRSAPRKRQPRRRQARATASAERDARVLDAVAAHPGATVAEISSVLGVDAVSLYRPVRDLASAGKIVKRGRGLFPASG